MPKFLIVADPLGDKQSAITRGLNLASQMDAQADIAGYCYGSAKDLADASGAPAELRQRLIDSQRAAIDSAIKKSRHSANAGKVSIEWQKNIYKSVIKRCRNLDYTTVIKTGHTSGSLLYTSTDWHLLRECPSGVMIVTPKRWKKGGTVVAAVDLATVAKAKVKLNYLVVEEAKSYAAAKQCDLHIVHVLRLNPVLTELDLVDQNTYIRERRAALAPMIDRVSRLHNIPKSRIHVKKGPIDGVICSESARLQANLVVVGAAMRTWLSAAVLGNTTEEILLRLSTDVLAVRN
ncbi:MAG: universal stress protein E [Halieaceae bacterium]|jgi:universal stress protein E